MPYVVGCLLALGVGLVARFAGLDRKRGFYPLVLAVVGSFYVLFAVMAGMPLLRESAIMASFLGLAVAGLRLSPWWVVAGLAGHGILDAHHGTMGHLHGVPSWWPAFCASYDLVAAGFLALVLRAPRLGLQAQARALMGLLVVLLTVLAV